MASLCMSLENGSNEPVGLVKPYYGLDYLVIVHLLILAGAVLVEKLLDYVGEIRRQGLSDL